MKQLLLLLFFIISGMVYGQQNVGIGTLTPNANAVLEIESTDKGVLIPRITTAQRNIFGAGLTNTENSMLVYDVNDSVFYYWKSTAWMPIPGIDTDEQLLSIIGDSLAISNGNRVLFIDNDTLNEKIDSVTYRNDTLKLYEGGVIYKTEIIGGEWSDADKIGMTDFVYAKQALNNGAADTVVITDDGKMGLGMSLPLEKLHLENGRLLVGRNTTDASTYTDPGSLELYRDSAIPVYNENGYIDFKYDYTHDADFRIAMRDGGLTTERIDINVNTNSVTNNITLTKGGNTGIGTITPTDKLHVNGNVRVGLLKDLAGGAVEPAGWGNLIHFSGGPDVSPGFNSDNSDGFYIGRYNVQSDLSELRIRLGDNYNAMNNDAFVIGSALSGVNAWNDFFRVQSNGFTGIGNNPGVYPTNQLHVIATANPLRLEGLNNGNSTDSVLSVNNTGVVRKIANPSPAGVIMSFAGATAPAGFLICDGSAVSRTTYADLFAVIGTTYGAGNGSTTFNLPDLRGEFIRGADAGRGIDPGRALGSNQLASPVVGDDNAGAPNDYSMQMLGGNPQFFDAYDPAYSTLNMWYSTAGGGYVYNPPHSGFVRASRPRNVALNYIIRY